MNQREGQQITKLGQNASMTDCITNLQTETLVKTCREVPLQVRFFLKTAFCCGVYVVNYSLDYRRTDWLVFEFLSNVVRFR